jgi:uncharacterized YigZ family protein
MRVNACLLLRIIPVCHRHLLENRIHYLQDSTMKRYPVPAEEIRRELVVVNSRFIASLAPVFSVDEAKSFIARIRRELAEATHHVPAYLVGGGDSVLAHCSDDGEPSGTAGRPALAVLRGSGLGDAAVVVTRYFGGTKLGTGGLVRAYGDAVRLVVEAVPRAERIATYTIMLALPYRLLERVRLVTSAHHGQILEETFAGDVTVTILIAVEELAAFQETLRDLSAGTLQAEVIETGERLVLIK